MPQTLFLRIAIPTPLRRLFTYLPPQDIDHNALIPGVRVLVPLQKRSVVGILISIEKESDVPYQKLKKAHQLLDTHPILPDDVYKICHWAADYYHYSLGEVFSCALPTLLRKGKPPESKKKITYNAIEQDKTPELNPAQLAAVKTINAALDTFKVFLLDGVTGSGKTEVYLRAIAATLSLQKQVLVLVPEISLTPQTVARFRARFSVPVVALHSNLSDQERLRAWLAARSNEVQIVIGTRSAIFTPFAKLGLIIVDEEHDTSFKQQDRFRYHARDLAIIRAQYNQIPVVLGSATPSLESLLNVKRQRYEYISLPQRAGNALLPTLKLIDIRQEIIEEGLSWPLQNMMREHLAQNNQIILFLNRRGYAPVFYCTQCAWIACCERCDARMVFHRSPPRLHCHHCDSRIKLITHCGTCGEATLQPIGLGTQRLEQTLENIFPTIPIIRVDRDTTRRKGAMQELLDEINTQQKAILIGTQMLAKGHHFPHVTLVAIIDADSGLFSADFRAAEQMGQLLMQVAGRAGRAEKPGTVAIQTRHPEHSLLQTLIHSGYGNFAQLILSEREHASLPPFTYLAIFKAEAYIEKNAQQFLTAIKELLPTEENVFSVHGPTPALLSKRKGLYCHHLLVKANKRSVLQNLLSMIIKKIEALALDQSVKWMLDVDPVEV